MGTDLEIHNGLTINEASLNVAQVNALRKWLAHKNQREVMYGWLVTIEKEYDNEDIFMINIEASQKHLRGDMATCYVPGLIQFLKECVKMEVWVPETPIGYWEAWGNYACGVIHINMDDKKITNMYATDCDSDIVIQYMDWETLEFRDKNEECDKEWRWQYLKNNKYRCYKPTQNIRIEKAYQKYLQKPYDLRRQNVSIAKRNFEFDFGTMSSVDTTVVKSKDDVGENETIKNIRRVQVKLIS